jgi:hypothetical protein
MWFYDSCTVCKSAAVADYAFLGWYGRPKTLK